MLIKDLNAFLHRSKKDNNILFFCPYCLHAFTKKTNLENHERNCSTNGAQKVELPTGGDDSVLEFTQLEKELKVPFVIYADFETLNRTLPTHTENEQTSANPHSKTRRLRFRI